MRTTSEQRWVLGLASVGSVMVALDVLVVAAALTTIRADLGASAEQLLGGAAGVAVLGTVFVSAGGYGGDGFTRALAGCGVLSLLGALSGLGITARRRTGGMVAAKAVEEVG